MAEPLKRDHIVQVYLEDRVLVEAVSLFAGAALGRAEAVVLIATPEHLARVERCLQNDGYEVDDLARWGQLVCLDAREALSRFMVDGMPDRALFRALLRDIVKSVQRSGRFKTIRAYGEMVNLLWRENLPAAVCLEELWNEAIQEHSISLFCAYALDVEGQAQRVFPPDLRALHSHFIPVESGG
ncbi:MAG TPA: MEDS domain-containing protein [Vicinamibacteria bacterium]|nr:MEDS domain-containing protein [Vicinamibacteria bacterium]